MNHHRSSIPLAILSVAATPCPAADEPPAPDVAQKKEVARRAQKADG